MLRRDLFVSTFAPRLGNGRDLRTYTIVRALLENGPLDLLYVPHGGGPSDEFTSLEGLNLIKVEPSRGPRRLAMAAIKRAQGWTTSVARSCSAELQREAEALAAAPSRGRVIAGDLNAMAMLMGFAKRHPVVYNAHNLESDYVDNPYVGRYHWLPIATLERRVLRTASESWMVSRRDVVRAQALETSARLRYVPNVVDTAGIMPVSPTPGGPALMVADYTYPPNLASVRWLLDEVMPLVWAQAPQTRVRLVGRGLELDSVDPRVEVAGFVEHLPDAYAGVSGVVVPLVQGAGTPLKFIEALAYGLPIVATPLATRGLDAVDGTHFLEGGTPSAFAAHLGRVLLADEPPGMPARARALAEHEYSVEALAARVADRPLELLQSP